MSNEAILIKLPTEAVGSFININDFTIPLIKVSEDICALLFRTQAGSGDNNCRIINGDGYFTDVNGLTNLGSNIDINASYGNTTIYFKITTNNANLVIGNARNIIKIGDQNNQTSLLGSGGAVLNRFDISNLLNLPLLTYFGARTANLSASQIVGNLSIMKDSLIADWVLGTATKQNNLVGDIKDIIKRNTLFIQVYSNGVSGTFKDLYDTWNGRLSSPITIIHSDNFTGDIIDIKTLARFGQLQISSPNITVDLNDLPVVGEILQINNSGFVTFTGSRSHTFYTTRSFTIYSFIQSREQIDNLILALANSPAVGTQQTSSSKNLTLRGDTSYFDESSPLYNDIRSAVEVLALRGMTINISNT